MSPRTQMHQSIIQKSREIQHYVEHMRAKD